MKIAHVIDYFQPEIGYQEAHLARAQMDEGHQVQIITSDRTFPYQESKMVEDLIGERIRGTGRFEECGFDVLRLPLLFEWQSRVWMRGLRGALRNYAADLVICHGMGNFTSLRVGRIMRSMSGRLIVDDHMQYELLQQSFVARAWHRLQRFMIGRVPILLHNFGEELFGFAVTVGTSGPLMGIVSQTLNLSISRELTFWVGADDSLRLRRAFSSACLLQLASGGLICLMGYLASPWAVSLLTVPAGYDQSAVFAIRLVTLDYGLAFMTSPYHALLIAHQDLRMYSVVVMAKRVNILIAALSIPFWSDPLIGFVGCQLLLNLPVNLWPVWLGLRGRPAYVPRARDLDWAASRSILQYGGLSFFSGVGNQLRRNGVALFLNMVFGNSVAAANAIGIRLSGIIHQFLSIFLPVIQPAITSSTGAGTAGITRRLVTITSTLSLAVALPLVIPILTDAEPLLRLWLQAEVPQYATIFAQLIALTTMAAMSSKGHEMALHATGRIARLVAVYQGLIIGFLILGAVATYSLKSHPWILQASELVGIVVANGLWQPYWVCKELDMDINSWLSQTLRPIAMLTTGCLLFVLCVCYWLETSVPRALVIGVGCGVMSVWTVWKSVLNENERSTATRHIFSLVKKASNRTE